MYFLRILKSFTEMVLYKQKSLIYKVNIRLSVYAIKFTVTVVMMSFFLPPRLMTIVSYNWRWFSTILSGALAELIACHGIGVVVQYEFARQDSTNRYIVNLQWASMVFFYKKEYLVCESSKFVLYGRFVIESIRFNTLKCINQVENSHLSMQLNVDANTFEHILALHCVINIMKKKSLNIWTLTKRQKYFGLHFLKRN